MIALFGLVLAQVWSKFLRGLWSFFPSFATPERRAHNAWEVYWRSEKILVLKMARQGRRCKANRKRYEKIRFPQ